MQNFSSLAGLEVAEKFVVVVGGGVDFHMDFILSPSRLYLDFIWTSLELHLDFIWISSSS